MKMAVECTLCDEVGRGKRRRSGKEGRGGGVGGEEEERGVRGEVEEENVEGERRWRKREGGGEGELWEQEGRRERQTDSI